MKKHFAYFLAFGGVLILIGAVGAAEPTRTCKSLFIELHENLQFKFDYLKHLGAQGRKTKNAVELDFQTYDPREGENVRVAVPFFPDPALEAFHNNTIEVVRTMEGGIFIQRNYIDGNDFFKQREHILGRRYRANSHRTWVDDLDIETPNFKSHITTVGHQLAIGIENLKTSQFFTRMLDLEDAGQLIRFQLGHDATEFKSYYRFSNDIVRIYTYKFGQGQMIDSRMVRYELLVSSSSFIDISIAEAIEQGLLPAVELP